MRILYVTGMTIPIRDLLSGKMDNEITGLPGFYYPWKKLVQKGHEVDIVMLSNYNDQYNIKVEWFKEDNIIANIYAPYTEYRFLRILRRVRRFLQLIYHTRKAVEAKKYDFVYCMMYEGVAGQIVARMCNIASGARLFGDFTFCLPDVERYGSLLGAIKHPLEYLSFKLGADFLLATDDGSKCDKLYEKWKPKRRNYPFYHWRTGIDMTPVEHLASKIPIPEEPFIFFAARFQDCKRHDRIIEVLSQLHERNIRLHLYLAGGVTSINYYNRIKAMVADRKLEQFVHFLGAVSQLDLKVLSYNAVAHILMCDNTNLGNVFYETFASGTVIISLRGRALEQFISDGVNGFLVNDEKEASLVVERLLSDPEYASIIRQNAIATANAQFMSIDERFDREVELIESVVKRKQLDAGLHARGGDSGRADLRAHLG